MLGDRIVVGDADILVALLFEGDANHKAVNEQTSKLLSQKYIIKFPNTAILEATVVLKRKLNKPDLASKLNEQFLAGEYNLVYVDETIQKLAGQIFRKTISKKNTIFDAIVLATAQILKADAVFSFDSWYKKQGMKMVEELI